MKHIIVFIVFLFMLFMSLPAETQQKLPSIDSLKELPVTLLSDFTEHEELASPALPVITRDGTLFFYDSKLKQLLKSHIDNRKLIPISRQGEGPREYISVMGMLIQDGFLYLLDYSGKVLCFSLDGEFKWEERTNFNFARMVAKSGDIFYFSKNSELSKDGFYIGLFQWKKGEKERLLTQLPVCFVRGDSISSNGKQVKGGAIMLIANPVFSLCKDTIIAAGNKEFTFNLLELQGNLKKKVVVEAPLPEPNKYHKMFRAKARDIYPIMDIFSDPPYIIVISNYFKEGKPRVDFFTMEGKLSKSFLLPVEVNSQSSLTFKSRVAAVLNGYLLYTDMEDIGFKVYRISVQ